MPAVNARIDNRNELDNTVVNIELTLSSIIQASRFRSSPITPAPF